MNEVLQLFDAVARGDEAGVAAVLAAHPDLVRAAGDHAKTALHLAAESDRLDVARLLVDAGADIEAKTSWGASPLDWAATMGSARVAEFLLGRGADAGTLITAAALGKVKEVEEIVESESDLTRHRRRAAPLVPDEHWPSDSAHIRGDVLSDALYAAARNGHTPVVSYLLAHGADLNAKGVFGATAIHWAAFNGHAGTVELLKSRGANLSLKDQRFDATPEGWAREAGHTAIAERLRKSRVVGREELIEQLQALGVVPGTVLIVHAAFSRVGPVEGGPPGLIDALRSVLDPAGTLVMPSMTDDDDRPFDPASSPCAGMGVVAETFWRMPHVRRTDSPHAFAAAGPRAAEITALQPVDVPHGADSPVGRVRDLDGCVLLLGVGHDADTTVHLAENVAGVRYRKRAHATVMSNGQPVRYDYGEIDHCCQNFRLLDEWLEAGNRQHRGIVGHAEARLARSRDIVDAALVQLRENETIFLHPLGVCGECDEARASLPSVARPEQRQAGSE
jgi:aminoglycoside N3'-acetyltransferase